MKISVCDNGVCVRNIVEKDETGIDKVEIVVESIGSYITLPVKDLLTLRKCINVFFSKQVI